MNTLGFAGGSVSVVVAAASGAWQGSRHQEGREPSI